MKKTNLHFLLILFLLFASCEKDEKNNVNPTFRLAESIVRNSEGLRIKATYHYEDEKLDEILYYEMDFNGKEQPHSKAKAHYGNDGPSLITYYYDSDNDEWLNWYKSVYVIENDLVIEEKYYDAKNSWKFNYEYENENLVAWKGYDEALGEPLFKGEYRYTNGLLSNTKAYYYFSSLIGWIPIDKETIMRSEGSISTIFNFTLDSLGKWVNEFKNEYTYSNDKITQIDLYKWIEREWSKTASSTYEYNIDNCLREIKNSDGSRANYKYEEGKGNLKLFYYYPEDLVYNQPTIKNGSNDMSQIISFTPYYLRYLYQNRQQISK